jgi:dienelactone hydrolase
MKRFWLRRLFASGLLIGLLTALIPGQATAADDCPALAPVCKIQNLPLPNGDLADVYYPNVPAAYRKNFKDAFPVVVVLQGANVDKSFYSQFGTRLALSLFVVVIPNHTQSLPLPPPAPPIPVSGLFTSRTVIPSALARIQADDSNLSSPLYTADTNTVGLVGHSFGGVAGLFASQPPPPFDQCAFPPLSFTPFCQGPYTRPAGLKAAVFYGTNLVVPNSNPPILTADLNTSGVAVALMQGTNDSLASLLNAQLTYPTLENPHGLITIVGANHYGITNVNNPPGVIPDPNRRLCPKAKP